MSVQDAISFDRIVDGARILITNTSPASNPNPQPNKKQTSKTYSPSLRIQVQPLYKLSWYSNKWTIEVFNQDVSQQYKLNMLELGIIQVIERLTQQILN